jgi:hypothetical protein
MASRGRRFKRFSAEAVAKILAAIESELSKSPYTQENALRTFIQRRIMHEQEETAQKISCTVYFLF